MSRGPSGTTEKALRLNLDSSKLGTFAEVGAGQEVVAHFFHAGHAAGTVAKSISAYDMAVSDAMYGPANRYVSRDRLRAMLEHEFDSLMGRLKARAEDTAFFACADTVATHTRSRGGKGHGWMGIRFQPHPKADASEILIHVRLLDPVTVREQEALGTMGVNLVYGAFYHHREPEALIGSLMDGLDRVTIEVDMIRFEGPAFDDVDNRLMSLQLVEQELTDAAMFTAGGEVVEPAEILYHRPALVERGSFRPVTNVMVDMLDRAREQLRKGDNVRNKDMVVLMEMTLNNLLEENHIDHRDFLSRADMLGALGYNVMISNFSTFHRLTSYLRTYTQERIGMVMGMATLQEIMSDKYYEELEGGILEALGRLFHGPVTLFAYPAIRGGDATRTAADLQVASRLQHLYAHLIENGFVQSIPGAAETSSKVLPSEVLASIQSGDSGWEDLVPQKGVELIKERRLFGYGGQ